MTEGSPDSPPQPVTTLYVGNLPPGVDEQILFHTFRAFGHIPDIQVGSHRQLLQYPPAFQVCSCHIIISTTMAGVLWDLLCGVYVCSGLGSMLAHLETIAETCCLCGT